MKHLFFSLKPRERLMALLGLVMLAFLWSTGAWGRVRGGWDDWQALEVDAKVQKTWLAKEKELRADAAKALQGLDAGKGYDEAKLVAETIAAAKECGLTPNTEAPKTLKAGRFATHTLQLSCRRAEIANIVKFYQNLAARAPYVALSSLNLQADRGSAGTVSMTAVITALELLEPAAPPAGK